MRNEEIGDLFGPHARGSLDEGDELAVPGTHDLAQFRVVARTRRLQDAEQPRPRAEQLDVAGCDRVECCLPRFPAAACSKASSVSIRQRLTAALNRSRFVPNRRKM